MDTPRAGLRLLSIASSNVEILEVEWIRSPHNLPINSNIQPLSLWPIHSGTKTRSSTNCTSRRFCDSNADGIGDFRGLTQKLDYLQELGVTAIWLLPIYPSPFKDDGYDISDYTDVHPSYGTLEDFQALSDRGAPPRAARHHRAGPEPHLGPAPLVSGSAQRRAASPEPRLVRLERHRQQISRTCASSSSIPSARTGPGTRYAKAYYWHRFFSHQPDLNYDNPRCAKRCCKVMKFWLDMGVDGFRAGRRALPRRARGHLLRKPARNARGAEEIRAPRRRAITPDACCWPKPTSGPRTCVAYFGDGDEFHMAFHFPLMPRMFMALRLEDRKPIIDILEQTPRDPRQLPVGHLPAQPRRADAGNGDRRRTRLHVPTSTPTIRACASTWASGAGWPR